MRFMEIPQRLQQLLSQPDPIVINHIISCQPAEGVDPKKTACYDIDVEIVPALLLPFFFLVAESEAVEGGPAEAADEPVRLLPGPAPRDCPVRQQGPTLSPTCGSRTESKEDGLQIFENVEQVKEHKTRRDFYLRFAEDPQDFIQKWLISQSQDLKVRALFPSAYVLWEL